MKLVLCILTAAAFSIISISGSVPVRSLVRANAYRAASPVSMEDILEAHGELGVLAAIHSYEIEMTKIVNTVPPGFFAQRVRLSVDGDKIKRLTTDPRNGRTRIELIDESGQFHALAVDQGESARSNALPANDQRRSAVRNNVSVCSLIPFLRLFSDASARAFYLDRGPEGADKYLVSVSGREFVVYLDQNRLIRRVDSGKASFEFADFRLVLSLRLPFVERISVGNRQVFEFFFREFKLDAAFDPDYFSRAAVEK